MFSRGETAVDEWNAGNRGGRTRAPSGSIASIFDSELLVYIMVRGSNPFGAQIPKGEDRFSYHVPPSQTLD
jgi:hypothetical protein